MPSPILSVLLLCAVAAVVGWGPPRLYGQPPGTPPPEEILDDQKTDPESLPIRAFLFLSDTGNPVIMPGLNWEELQRLMDLDAGNGAQRDAFTYQSLEISGEADDGRAELEVVLCASVEPTKGRWISIPLKMGNFHKYAPPDVTGVAEYYIKLLPDGLGYQLMVKSDTSAELTLRMEMKARVENVSLSRSLEFRLPDVPSKVALSTDTKDAAGDVIGRGDETMISIADADRTKFLIESSGGTFSLRWGKPDDARAQLLDVESRVSIRWASPQNSPIASVRANVESLRGSIDSLQLRLPNGAVMLNPPQIGTNGQTLELGAATTDKDGTVHEISIPNQERRSRIDLNFEIQLDSRNASPQKPLGLRIPEIVGALRHHGELQIRTSGDYRLRWRSTRPWLRLEPSSNQVEGEVDREYRFRFDRFTADFPIWLGKEESQLRMASESKITIREAMASLDMTIRPSGQLSEGGLQLDEAAWQLRAIENLESQQPLDSYISGFVRVIELNSNDQADPTPIRIRAVYPLEPDQDRIELPLPRVVDTGDAALVQNATVDIVSAGRKVFVVDLEATKDLRRAESTLAEVERDRLTSHFQVLNLESPIVIVGNLVDQPPQITFSSDAKVELDGRQLRTIVDWKISSRTDLEGRLPIRIPKLAVPQSVADSEMEQAATTSVDDEAELFGVRWGRIDRGAMGQESSWRVTINDVPATLRPLDDDRYELISDHLADGTMAVRWQHELTLAEYQPAGCIGWVSLPRPNITDVTRLGTLKVGFQGNQNFELSPIDAPGTSDLQLDSLPRDPILLRVKPRQNSRQQLSIRQAILRTVVGHRTRHEQLLAWVQGGDQFRVGLPESTTGISVEGFIDGDPATVRRDKDALLLTLPGDRRPHAVDLRVWIPKQTPSLFATVTPSLRLPIGSGRVFWQILAPRDGHVIWTTPTLGRSMTWQFDRWKLYRTPTHTDARLAALIPSAPNPLPAGNQYLYVGSDPPAFKVLVVSRLTIWLIVGTFVLLATALLTYLPQVRHPLSVVVAAVLFAGLLVVAPDAAVIAGQFGIIALVLVIVMVTIRALVAPGQTNRLFPTANYVDDSHRERSVRTEFTSPQNTTGVPTTQSFPPPSPTEASS